MVAIACGGDSSTGPDASPVGSFLLSQYNGKSLPVTVFADVGFMDVLTGGTLSVASDGSYLATISVNETVDGNLSTYVDSGSGKWTRTGRDMVFIGVDSTRQPAVWDGTTITLTDSSTVSPSTLAFRRK
ncbi:hypothetical protein BH09GEM1_BH09GEM1_16490 [soil metagenome]